MDPEAIEFFALVARTGSISKAATELGIEPSTLARRIGRLEDDAGLRLFHRSGRGMVLTDAGALFLEEAEKVVESLAHARRVAADLSAGGPSQIVIAAQPTIAQVTFGPLAEALRVRFPRARVRLIEGLGHQVVSWLQEGQTDVAVMYVPPNPQIADYDLLLQEPLHAFLPPDHTHPGDSIRVEEFVELPLILPSTPHGIRGLVEDWARRSGKRMRVVLEHDGSTFVTRRLVQFGHGCSLGPLAAAQDDLRRGLLRAVRLAGPDTLRAVAIFSARNRPSLRGLHEVHQTIRQVASELVTTGAWPGVERMAG
ncbi:MAG: LysR family transcriptional regulator [Rubrivivax sp.]|nr:LysR family transcriptional regulator [Rubrivivax sp.]